MSIETLVDTLRKNESKSDIRRVLGFISRGRCVGCLCRNKLTLHHIVPARQGGALRRDNAVPLCRTCHDAVEGYGSALARRSEIISRVVTFASLNPYSNEIE